MKNLLKSLSERKTLSRSEAASAMHILLRGQATPVQIAGFLMALRSRGETLDELVGLTQAMRSHAVEVNPGDPSALDIVGTGGDMHGTFNISTAAALVCAGAGVRVAKHGNRSVSSKCGSSDVLEALGVQTDLGKSGVEYCLQQAGIAFLFAPNFHPALRHVMPVRRALGVRTCFNILGPLCNPAPVKRHLVGAFSTSVAESMAEILLALGSTHVMTLHGHDGLDEASVSGKTTVFSHFPGQEGILREEIAPEDFSVQRSPLESIVGGDAGRNAEMVKDVLSGEAGPALDIVIMNAALGLKAAGACESIGDAVSLARESISGGAAMQKLGALIEASQTAPKD